jgi:hypothetical protein
MDYRKVALASILSGFSQNGFSYFWELSIADPQAEIE